MANFDKASPCPKLLIIFKLKTRLDKTKKSLTFILKGAILLDG